MWLVAAGSGCTPPGQPLPWPSAEAQVLIHLDPAGPRAQVRAGALGPFSLRGEVALALLTYDRALSVLGLEQGALTVAPVGSGEALPRPDAAFELIDGALVPAQGPALAQALALRFLRKAPSCPACATFEGEGLDCRACPEPPALSPPAPPAPPIPPNFQPCPSGWRPANAHGASVCEPAVGVPCAPGQAHFFDGVGCVAVDAPCGPGPFPGIFEPAVFVDPVAAPGGDGARERPFRTLDEALAVIAPGGLVALGPGAHTTSRPLLEVRLKGACAAETRLNGQVSIQGGTVQIEGLRLEAGLTVEAPARWIGRGVVAMGRLLVNGAAELELVSHEGAPGPAIQVGPGGVLNGRRIAIRGAGTGLSFDPGARAQLESLAIRGVPIGVLASAATIELRGAVIEGGIQGIVAAEGTLWVNDVVVRGASGPGLTMRDGDLAGARLWIDRSGGHNLVAERSTVDLLDLVSTRAGGRGLELGSATGTVARAHFGGNLAFQNFHSRGGLKVEDVTVREQVGVEDGIVFYGPGPVTFTRAQLQGTHGSAVVIASPGRYADLAIDGALGSGPNDGRGVAIRDSRGAVLVERLRVEGADDFGLTIGFGADPEPLGPVALSDLRITDAGQGLSLHAPSVTVTRAEVRASTFEGIELGNANPDPTRTATITDLLIEGAALDSETNAALLVQAQRLRLVRAQLIRSGRGLLVRPETSLYPSEVWIADNVVGITAPGPLQDWSGLILGPNLSLTAPAP